MGQSTVFAVILTVSIFGGQVFGGQARAGGYKCKVDLKPQICADAGQGLVTCKGKREMCIPAEGTVLTLRDVEIRLEDLQKVTRVFVSLEPTSSPFSINRTLIQPTPGQPETQVTVYAQSVNETDVKVICHFEITGERANAK